MFSPEVLALEPQLVAWRRALHEHPELSFREVWTTQYLEQTLRGFGVTSLLHPTGTGLVAVLRGTKAGKPAALGLRADIDALPIEEAEGAPCRSRVPGVMHACGHDGHAAMLLALARLLAERRGDFCGEARLLFQPAEELPPGGAAEMVKAGAADGLDAVLGLHFSSAYPMGVFGLRAGALTANTDRFDITVTGRGGHCAYPERCTDVIVAGSQLVCALQTIVSRRVAADAPTVVSVCQAQAGSAYNILPDEMTFSGTTRCFGPEARAFLKQELARIARGVAQASGTDIAVRWEEGYPSVMNDPALERLAASAVRARFGEAAALPIGPILPGEDFPYFLENGTRPGFFAELGTRSGKPGTDMPHHSAGFRIDEDALKYGVQYELDLTLALLDGRREWL